MSMPPRTIGVRTYVVTALVLLVLTCLTIGVAFLPLGPWHTPVALGIAAVKAVLVAVYFMHLRISPPVNRLAALAGLFWLAIMLAGTLDDVVTRGWLPIPGK
jgi:cytochrome c oxidase subunit 4